MSSKTRKWKRLRSFPKRFISNLVVLDDHHIIAAPTNMYGKRSDGIYKYNKYRNKWQLFIKYPNHFDSSDHSLCLNEFTNELYLYGVQNKFVKINIDPSEFVTIQNVPSFGSYPPIIFIENKFHVICGEKNKKHLIFNQDTLQFDEFISLQKLISDNNNLKHHSMVYISGSKELLLFGDRFLWIYSEKNNNWNERSRRLPYSFYNTSCILTKDEKFIIAFGGGYSETDSVYIIKLSNNNNGKMILTFIESSFKLPTANPVHVAQIKNINVSCLIYGYIKSIYNILLLPLDIIEMIAESLGDETDYSIHLIDRITTKHWKIDLDIILASYKSNILYNWI